MYSMNISFDSLTSSSSMIHLLNSLQSLSSASWCFYPLIFFISYSFFGGVGDEASTTEEILPRFWPDDSIK
jgi:hypothetical protein